MRKVIAIVGIAGLGLAWAAMPASAGANPQFTISPHSGPPGTVIHAADNEATCNFEGDFDVHVELIAPDSSVVDQADTTNAADGTWEVDLTVPGDAELGDYIVTARCFANQQEFSRDYDEQPFTVTAPPETTTTTTTTTTTQPVKAAATTTTTTTVPPPVVAPAATPVVATPALTG